MQPPHKQLQEAFLGLVHLDAAMKILELPEVLDQRHLVMASGWGGTRGSVILVFETAET